jgi:hypothetical protein
MRTGRGRFSALVSRGVPGCRSCCSGWDASRYVARVVSDVSVLCPRSNAWTGTAAPGGRRIKLVDEMRNAEVRVHRGGVALLWLWHRERLDDRCAKLISRDVSIAPLDQEGEGPMTEETMPARGSTESVMPQAQPATAVQGTATSEVSR